MTNQAQRNQEYLEWYFRTQEPQKKWDEIRPEDIVPREAKHSGEVERWIQKLLGRPEAAKRRTVTLINPWALKGLAAGNGA